MEELMKNIIENTPQTHFWIIWFSGIIFSYFYSLIITIYNAIENRMWIIKDYEKIIADNLGTYVTDDNKEKMLIANAKRNTERRNKYLKKRKLNKEKIKKIFIKKRKSDN